MIFLKTKIILFSRYYKDFNKNLTFLPGLTLLPMKHLHFYGFFLLLTSTLFAQKPFVQTGKASYYAAKFDGRRTANGETFDSQQLTAAHRELAFNTWLRVTNLENQKSVVVRVNDRGPFKSHRILDVSKAAADRLDMTRLGTATVRIEVVGSDGKINENLPPVAESKKTDNPAAFSTGKTYSQWGTERLTEGFGIQLFSFADLENAKVKCRELTAKKLEEVLIQVGWEKNAKRYRVLYGTFDSKKEARSFQKKLKKAGYKGFVRKY
jgi:rare lipoprotein A